MIKAKYKAQKICGHYNKPGYDVEKCISKLTILPIQLTDLYSLMTRKEIRNIVTLDLGLKSDDYSPYILKVISQLCLKASIFSYCRLEMGEYIEPEKRVYLVGPAIVCYVIKTIIKYLFKCEIMITSYNKKKNTKISIKDAYYNHLYSILSKLIKTPMRYRPVYKKLITVYMLSELIFDTPTHILVERPHWIKSVKMRTPKFKDKWLI